MDFQFYSLADEITVKCSMGHEAVANWFNSEVRLDSGLIFTALSCLQQAKQLPNQEFKLIGREYSLFICSDEIMFKANHLAFDEPIEQEEGLYYYDEESLAFCGLEDFEHFLRSYLSFNN